MMNEKEALIEQMKKQRFMPITEDTFTVFKKYASLIEPSNPDDIANLLFFEGECFFRIGSFNKALSNFSRCIHAPKSASLKILDAKSHNLAGVIYGYLGQEWLAKNDLLAYLKIAQENHYTKDIAMAYINLGFLHAILKDYETALDYERKAMEYLDEKSPADIYSMLTCLSYQGIFCAKLEQMEESVSLLSHIRRLVDGKEDVFYDAATLNLVLRVSYYKEDMTGFVEAFERFLKFASSNEDFMSYSEFYFDICDFLMENNMPEETKQLLNYMQAYSSELPLVCMQYNILEYQTAYAQKFCSDFEYMENAGKLISLIPAYEEEQRQSKLYSLEYIERLHQTRNLSNKLEEKSKLDPMTGLLNKYTIEFLVDEYLNTKPDNITSAVLLIDMDHFKQINDTLGHLAGDKIISDTASIIRRFFNENAFCGRVGGDEFLVFIQSMEDSSALVLQAELLRQEIFKEISEHSVTVTTQASIGIAVTGKTLNNYSKLFIAADNALYEAKKDGRNKVVFAEE